MPSTWAPNDWLASDKPTHTHLNNIGNSIRTWGYGSTAGTVTINANQNQLSALGVLTFHSSGYVSGRLRVPAATNNANAVVNNAIMIGHTPTETGLFIAYGGDGLIANALRGCVMSHDDFTPYSFRWGKHTANEPLKANGSNFTLQMELGNDGNLTLGGKINQDAWQNATLANSWVAYGGGYPTLQYRVDKQNRVWIRGTIKNGTFADGTVIATGLPAVSTLQVMSIAGVPASGQVPQMLYSGTSLTVYGVGGNGYLHCNFSASIEA